MSNNNTVLLVGFIVSLIAIWLIAYFLGMILSKMFSLSGLGIFDRFLGFIFGAGKVFLLFSIIAYAASQIDTFKTKLDEKLSDSFMYPLLSESGSAIIKLDTGEISDTISKGVDSVVEGTKEVTKEIGIEAAKEEIQNLTKEQ
jgi:membrane protein required for colicin V production